MPAETMTQSIADRVRDAQAARRPVRVVGAGTWRHAFAPDAVDTIDTSGLVGIVEYVPGDLTITVKAGTSLSQIEQETARHAQWLTLDPFGSPEGSIGATVSSASSGPLATGFGTPRDVLLGLSVVTGTATSITVGGRVVKNVAGFDLPRLFTGSRGTLGVITEVTLRLRGRPTADETIAIAVSEKPAALKATLSSLRALSLAPMAAELLGPVAAGRLGLEAATTLLLRFGGNPRAVAAAKKKAGSLGKAIAADPATWSRYRALDDEFESVFRINDLPTAFVERWSAIAASFGSNFMLSGSPLRGQLRCAANGVARDAFVSVRAATKGASFVFDSLPDSAAWNALSAVPDAGSLHGRVRAAFDPTGIMNPGALRLAR